MMVFEDASEQRKKFFYVSVGIVVILATLFIVAAIFGFSALASPSSYGSDELDDLWGQYPDIYKEIGFHIPKEYASIPSLLLTITPGVAKGNPWQKNIDKRISELKKIAPFPHPRFLHTAFLLQDDFWDSDYLEDYASQLDLVFADWFGLGASECELSEHIRPDVSEIFHSKRVSMLPVFSLQNDALSIVHFSRLLQNSTQ